MTDDEVLQTFTHSDNQAALEEGQMQIQSEEQNGNGDDGRTFFSPAYPIFASQTQKQGYARQTWDTGANRNGADKYEVSTKETYYLNQNFRDFVEACNIIKEVQQNPDANCQQTFTTAKQELTQVYEKKSPTRQITEDAKEKMSTALQSLEEAVKNCASLLDNKFGSDESIGEESLPLVSNFVGRH